MVEGPKIVGRGALAFECHIMKVCLMLFITSMDVTSTSYCMEYTAEYIPRVAEGPKIWWEGALEMEGQ